MTLPAFVEQGDELGEIALLVIRARDAGASSRAWADNLAAELEGGRAVDHGERGHHGRSGPHLRGR